MALLKILGRKDSSNVQKVLWCCAELEIPFEREDVGGHFGKNDQPPYLAMNPNGRVPTIVDDGFVMWESNAIVRYLCAKHDRLGKLLPQRLQQRAHAEQWMDWQQTTLSADMRTLSRTLLATPADKTPPDRLETSKQNSIRAWRIVEAQLASHDYLVGPTLTMADIVFGNAVHRWHAMPFERPDLPMVARWYERLKDRAAYRQHVLDA